MNVDTEETDVFLVDSNYPAGLGAKLTHHIREQHSQSRVLAFVASDIQDTSVNCIAAGAHGRILEEASLEELHTAIDSVVRGEAFCSPQFVLSMFSHIAASPPTKPPTSPQLGWQGDRVTG